MSANRVSFHASFGRPTRTILRSAYSLVSGVVACLCVACGGSSEHTPGTGDFDADVRDICRYTLEAPCNPGQTRSSCSNIYDTALREAGEAGCDGLYEVVVDCWARNGSECNKVGLYHVGCDSELTKYLTCMDD